MSPTLGVALFLPVARLVRSGSLPAHRTGSGQFRVERGLFDRWIREQYAETRRWILEHPKPGFIHGDWRDWPIGRVDDGRAPTKGLTGADGDSFPA